MAVRLRGLMPKPLGPWPQCREPPNPAPQRLHPLLRQKKKES
ncbi:lactate utilisation protein LutB domain-containing protein [Aeromonas dhakensis]|nr:lactate utilisation protein LutB domain-containing protein [Aeromonas dhakensis]